MTGDGGEYLRAEDLRELGDDSLPGQYLDGMNYLRFSLEGGRTDRYHPIRRTTPPLTLNSLVLPLLDLSQTFDCYSTSHSKLTAVCVVCVLCSLSCSYFIVGVPLSCLVIVERCKGMC